MKTARVRVRRDRPSALSWTIALAVTMLVVYLVTLNAGKPDVVESMSAAPRVTQTVVFESMEMYFVSLAQCATAEEARIQASGFTYRGAAGSVYEAEDAWHVLGAAYESQRDAQRIADRLNDEEDIPAALVHVSVDALNMRITAPETQIAAIIEANQILRNQTQQLGAMALQLDRNEIRPDAARTLCGLACTEASDASKLLQAIPGATENGLCAALIERLDLLSEMLNAIASSTQDSSAALSSMLRCAQIENYMGLCALQRSMTGA